MYIWVLAMESPMKVWISHIAAAAGGGLVVFMLYSLAFSQAYVVDTKFGKILCFPPGFGISD